MVGSPDFLTGQGTDQSPEFQELESPEGEMHLRFFLQSGIEMALPAVSIREVTEPSPDRITPVPNVSPLLLGTLNIRGQVIWVADLGQFLGELAPLSTDRADIPVIAIEDQERMLGLAVAKIAKMDWLDVEQLKAARAVGDEADFEAMKPFLRGEWHLGEDLAASTLRLLDHGAILSSERWGGGDEQRRGG